MQLSSGGKASLTKAPTGDIATDPIEGAKQRFQVRGSAIVAGGAGVLGLRACDALLEHGLNGLMIFDINPAQAEPQITALRLKFPHVKIKAMRVDVTNESEIAAAVEATATEVGSVDVMISFVGIVGCVDALDMSIDQWRRILDINTTGSFICAQAAARQMVKQGTGGSIILTSSISAHRVNYPQPQAAYNVSKAALLSLKSCLAAEWARYGIRTNTISPGYMDTVLNEGDGIAEHRAIWAQRNPTGRMGCPSELTGVVVLLASQAGTYINGADIIIDGGGVVF
jgi:NAD(P)-dependent dehydrogenase (short-subunit alcohol dehydrogenase family)